MKNAGIYDVILNFGPESDTGQFFGRFADVVDLENGIGWNALD